MHNDLITFDITEDIASLGVRLAVFYISGLSNRTEDSQFESLKTASLDRIRAGLSPQQIKTDPILQAFRDIHTQIGFSNRDYVAASESLLNYLHKNGVLPRVNLLVDIYNLVSIETRLALGAHDISRVSGSIHLRRTSGDEIFWPLGSDQPKPSRTGGYAYIDDSNEVICMLEVRQVQKSKATLDTRDCFYIIQGNARTSFNDLQQAARRLSELTRQFCGGEEHGFFMGGYNVPF